jgi:hypothetical protein
VGQGTGKLYVQFRSSQSAHTTSFQDQAAAGLVYCAVSADLNSENGGKYFNHCTPKSPSNVAQSSEMAERLWALSEFMIQTHQQKLQRSIAKLERQCSSPKSSIVSCPLQTISEDGERDLSSNHLDSV